MNETAQAAWITKFAPLERTGKSELERQSENILARHCQELMANSPNPVLILNECRQVVFASQGALDILGRKTMESVLGARPGELFACIHACKEPGGCGTSEYCAQCGAVLAIMAGMDGRPEQRECQMLRHNGQRIEAVDIKVAVYPLRDSAETYLAFYLNDISSEKRRKILEETFFHDIMNEAGGIESLARMLREHATEATREYTELLCASSRELVEGIKSQRDLLAAECNELPDNFCSFPLMDVLDAAAGLLGKNPVASGRHVRLLPECQNMVLESDPTILRRVMVNMLKNALEAVGEGQTVTVGCQERELDLSIFVHNPGVIAREAQLQIFKRSFSTKGRNRGIGTYSMKLFTEGHLGGKVDFTSSQEQGTTFTVILPKRCRTASSH
jgi:signal transduction histidine kinase